MSLSEVNAVNIATKETLNDDNPWSMQDKLLEIYWSCDQQDKSSCDWVTKGNSCESCLHPNPLISDTCSNYKQEGWREEQMQKQSYLNPNPEGCCTKNQKFWHNKIDQGKFENCLQLSQGDQDSVNNCMKQQYPYKKQQGQDPSMKLWDWFPNHSTYQQEGSTFNLLDILFLFFGVAIGIIITIYLLKK